MPRGFSPAALEEAEAQATLASRLDGDRRDLTGLVSFTIDPDEARDFDDAISLVDGPGEGEVTLYVHIADVSYFVPAGSAVDREAQKKACSAICPWPSSRCCRRSSQAMSAASGPAATANA